jgi:UDP-4-amino-4-deoxy-L-arabinose formyltransferase/UDP-glucuronic acid dehydrogenase (UDP-4-keto-hexauronic acid decarboxylating)
VEHPNVGEPLRVLLVAAEAAGAHVLRVIEAGGFSVAGLLMSSGEGGERPLGSSVAATVKRLGCPVWPARSVRDPAFAETVRAAEVDILINVHSLYVIRGPILDAPRIGSFNMHPGPLPEGAGLNAVSWALYEGRRDHAVTVHWMAAGIDTGAVAYEARMPIEDADTAFTLSAKCVKAGVPLIERLLTTAADDPAAIPSIPQDLTRRQYRGREIPQEGRIDWAKTARETVDFVRACDYGPYPSPWGRPQTTLGGVDVSVLKAARTGMASSAAPGTVGDVSGRGVMVSGDDEWVLVQRLSVNGRGVDAADVLGGHERLDAAPALI